MLAKVLSGTVIGMNAVAVTVEVDVSSGGLPNFTIVGLADRSVEESKERVRSAIRNTGAEFPPRRLTVNLAPADLPKEGPVFDLAIAIGLLIGSGQLEKKVEDTLFVGELSLDGGLRRTKGMIALIQMAKKSGLSQVFIPEENSEEGAILEGITVYAFKDLSEVVEFLNNRLVKEPLKPQELTLDDAVSYEYDFSQIKGQEQARRALEIAAAGSHNVLLKGPPGSGKTLLSRSFPSILPSLTKDEAIEISQIHSLVDTVRSQKVLLKQRPFRSPHHTASYVGIIGGGNRIKPGEVSLAHRGILFLDELPEFPRQVLEALRQPIEDREVVISRASGSINFPAQFILIAALNPCPCGYFNSNKKSCTCNPLQVSKYQKKISGPLLDRIDIHLEVPAVEVDKLTQLGDAEPSGTIRERVEKARQRQLERFKYDGILTNSEMQNNHIKKYCHMDDSAIDLIKKAVIQMNLSARSYNRILKLARTIADMDGKDTITAVHIGESLQYRFRDNG